MWETWIQSQGSEDPLEKEMATYSSTLAWKIPYTEPGGLQSMGLQRVGHDWVTSLSLFSPLWRTVSRFFKKLGIKLPYDPATRHIPWGNHNWKRYMYLNAHCSIIYNSRTWKQLRCPSTNKWIKKLWYIYTVVYYSSIKRNMFDSFLIRWMNLEPIIQNIVNQKEKNKCCILKHIYGI